MLYNAGFNYIIKMPKDYIEGNKYPLILFLHGAGERGCDEKSLTPIGPLRTGLEEYIEDFVVVSPQCPLEITWFDVSESLDKFIDFVINLPFVDNKRIYLTGLSMGGYGAFQIAMRTPSKFTALVTCCGGGMYWNAEKLKDLPTLAYHGIDDDIVSFEESVKMVHSINKFGGNAKLITCYNCGHGCWDYAYANKEMYKWLLSHKKI